MRADVEEKVIPIVADDLLAPKVPIQLDKLRHLTIDLNVLAGVESRLGIGASQINLKHITHLRAILTISLQQEDPDVTEEQIGRLVFPKNIKYVSECLNKAWEMNSEPAKDDEKKDEKSVSPLAVAIG